MLRIAFISDVHIGPSGYHNGIRRKLTEHALPFIDEFIDDLSKPPGYAFPCNLEI
ncbi:MAG TPA: hypothetical protein PLP17_01815 [Oligoflexia bacterium]|nr:hypothetical protein [Oligoflexia bacterium]